MSGTIEPIVDHTISVFRDRGVMKASHSLFMSGVGGKGKVFPIREDAYAGIESL